VAALRKEVTGLQNALAELTAENTGQREQVKKGDGL
jgi:hypothetical protein